MKVDPGLKKLSCVSFKVERIKNSTWWGEETDTENKIS